MYISVLIACHNRKNKTLACVSALFKSELPRDCRVGLVVVDDGSTDGTSEALLRLHPETIIKCGDGSLFWNRGMHMAQKIAEETNPDFYLWLNDDTILAPGAILSLYKAYNENKNDVNKDVIIVGATADPSDGRITYAGAISKSKLRRFTYTRVWDERVAMECEVMNGNVVLIPRSIANDLVNIDPAFEHAMGDTDYALRAGRAGHKIFVAPGVAGTCQANPPPVVRFDSNHSLMEKWRSFTGRKGLPFASWRHFTRRHGGFLWLAYFVQPYAKFWWRAIGSSISRKFGRSASVAP